VLAWEAHRIHERRGDARRLLLSRLVIDHRLASDDPFRLADAEAQRAITDALLGDRALGMAEAGQLIA
jgi:acyl-CoA dehydrogenase